MQAQGAQGGGQQQMSTKPAVSLQLRSHHALRIQRIALLNTGNTAHTYLRDDRAAAFDALR